MFAAGPALVGRRQAAGVALAIILLLAGREVRRRLLVGPDGAWRDPLWLDEVVEAPANADPAETASGLAAPPAGEMRDPAAAPGRADPTATDTPGRPESRPRAARGGSRPAASPKLTAPLRINRCSVDSLQLLPGVGPVMAARIDESRRSGMIFRVPADLRKVKGIGPATLARLAPLVLFADPALDGVPPGQSPLKSKGSRPN